MVNLVLMDATETSLGIPRRGGQRGYIYVVLLFALLVFGIGLAKVGEWTSEQARRDRELELLRCGETVVAAIRDYYLTSPGVVRTFPKSWSDLTQDPRFLGPVRHLRAAPIDPITQSDDWEFIASPDGGFAGVYSPSEAAPVARVPVIIAGHPVAAVQRYRDWRFAYDPQDDPAPFSAQRQIKSPPSPAQPPARN